MLVQHNHPSFFLSNQDSKKKEGKERCSVRIGPGLVDDFFWKWYCSTFVVIWQLVSNHSLIRFKRFVSWILFKLCNIYVLFIFNTSCMCLKIRCDGESWNFLKTKQSHGSNAPAGKASPALPGLDVAFSRVSWTRVPWLASLSDLFTTTPRVHASSSSTARGNDQSSELSSCLVLPRSLLSINI